MKKKKERKNRMAHCSFQEFKIIMVIIRNLPYPSRSLQVSKKKNEKREVAHFLVSPCHRMNVEIKKYTH